METITPRRSLRLMQKDGAQLSPNSLSKGLPPRTRTSKKLTEIDTENNTNTTPPQSIKKSKKKTLISSVSSLSSPPKRNSPKRSSLSSPQRSSLSSPQRSPLSPKCSSPLALSSHLSSPLSSHLSSPLVRSSPTKSSLSSSPVSSPPCKRSRMRSPSSAHVAFTPSPSGTSRRQRQPSSLIEEASALSSPHTPTKKPPRAILKSPKLDISPTLKKVWASGSQPHLEKLVEIHTAMNTRSPRHIESPKIVVTPRRLKFKAAQDLVEPHYYSPKAKPSRRLSKSPDKFSSFRDMRTGKTLSLGAYKHTHQEESEEEYDSDDIDQFISGKNTTNKHFFEEEEEEDVEEEEEEDEEREEREGEKERGNSEEELPSSGMKRKRRESGGLSGDEEPHMNEYLRHSDDGADSSCTIC